MSDIDLLKHLLPDGLIESYKTALRQEIAAELEAAATPGSPLFNEHFVKGLFFAAQLIRR